MGEFRRVHGFASRDHARPYLRVFVINKLEAPQMLRIKLHAGGAPLRAAEAMVDTEDHWGTRRSLNVTCAGGSGPEGRGGVCEVLLPPVSFVAMTTEAREVTREGSEAMDSPPARVEPCVERCASQTERAH